jgi:hypothetical protein
MADQKLSQLTAATLPLAGTELAYLVQGGAERRTTAAAIATTLPDATTSTAGKLSAADKTKLDSITADQATIVRRWVRNETGSTIAKGIPVYISVSNGVTPTVIPADASTEETAARTIGLTQAAINHQAYGWVIEVGRLEGINTSTLTEGQIIWLSETTGQMTTTRPTQPAHGVILGYCVKQGAGTSGIVDVKVDNGLELAELHDVLLNGAATGDVLALAADGLWKKRTLGGAAALNVGTVAGTVAAGDAVAALATRLDQFRDACTFYVSKRIAASDSNNGTSEGEPFLTIGAAVTAANAYVTANPGAKAKIFVGPGRFVEAALPLRLKPNILIQGALQRATTIQPAAGQELNSIIAVDSGCMICDLTFAGHQAQSTSPTDSTVGTRAWAITFNEQANGGTGVILTASPYIKDCLSLTAEDDAGEAGSTSTGDCGGGVEVDGAKCAPNSPIRSMVVYGFTQQNLGGPGAIVKNEAYAELVSFFGLFGTWHVRAETGGQVTMSGGGCSEFGTYGLMADGYSPTAIFTGALLANAAQGVTTVDIGSLSANRIGSASRPGPGQLMILAGTVYVVQSATPITGGFRVGFYSPTSVGLAAAASTGAAVNFRLRSQINAGCHTVNYVGSGTNYSALPWNGGVPIRANETVETNFGRVFGATLNDVGDFKVSGGAFAVDGTTGAVTINTSSFNLSGLNAVGPFSRNGGISTVGVQLQEVSNEATLLASTGVSDGNTAPTQLAVRSYTDNRFLAGLTAASGSGLTITDTSTQDGAGFWTRTRSINNTGGPSMVVIPLTGESAALIQGVLITVPYWPDARVLSALPIWMLNTAPTGSVAQFDIRVGGTSIFATLPTIDATETSTATAAVPAVFSAAFIAASQTIALGANVTIHCTQVGSTVAGSGAKVALPGRRVG